MTPRAALERGVADLALSLSPGALERMLQYLALLKKWNRTYNLTAVHDAQQMVGHHLLDSLAVLPYLPMPAGRPTLADVGSGAGLPGVPLALARPSWRVTLIDSSEKRAAFLRQSVMELGMQNVDVYQGRVEQWQPEQRFDLVISRAFAELGVFFAACRHLLAPTGVLAAMKGKLPSKELAPATSGCACQAPIRLRVPFLDAERNLLLCRAPS
ncbi:MAG TPA: 16S rRNA (guanine(527)-N(7))-methyltransferase RsmG [Burkholderiales bacterium]|nr:16S rRNA (guanine(527)-N(7))-methyltransferase RsmG [Burkholderiales bacterium]